MGGGLGGKYGPVGDVARGRLGQLLGNVKDRDVLEMVLQHNLKGGGVDLHCTHPSVNQCLMKRVNAKNGRTDEGIVGLVLAGLKGLELGLHIITDGTGRGLTTLLLQSQTQMCPMKTKLNE